MDRLNRMLQAAQMGGGMSGGAPGQASTNTLTSSKPELCIGRQFERFSLLDDLAYILPYILICRAVSETTQDAAYPCIHHEERPVNQVAATL